jgi:hypothetical protein
MRTAAVARQFGIVTLALVALLATAGLATAARADNDTSVDITAATAAAPDDAVGAAVRSLGETYAGDCARTVSPRDAGKMCSRLEGEQSGARAYLVGRTFSEFTTWVFVAPAPDGGWRVVTTAPLDFFDMSGAIPWPAATVS